MVRKLSELIVLIKGGGEIASGIAHRLHQSHFRLCLTEIANPLAVSRGTAFSEAVFDGEKTIEGVILRGLLRNGLRVSKKTKLVEVDPVNNRAICYVIRDKMRAIAGGVLEAIMLKLNITD